MQRVLDLAVTAEALAITFYQRVIATPGGLFGRLRGEQRGSCAWRSTKSTPIISI
jgi:hypothetical protein